MIAFIQGYFELPDGVEEPESIKAVLKLLLEEMERNSQTPDKKIGWDDMWEHFLEARKRGRKFTVGVGFMELENEN